MNYDLIKVSKVLSACLFLQFNCSYLFAQSCNTGSAVCNTIQTQGECESSYQINNGNYQNCQWGTNVCGQEPGDGQSQCCGGSSCSVGAEKPKK